MSCHRMQQHHKGHTTQQLLQKTQRQHQHEPQKLFIIVTPLEHAGIYFPTLLSYFHTKLHPDVRTED